MQGSVRSQGQGLTFSQTMSITFSLTYFLLTAFPSFSSCRAGEVGLSSPFITVLFCQLKCFSSAIKMIGEKIQICNISKKKEEKDKKKTCLKSKADFFGDPMGTPSGRGEGAEGSERAKEGGGSWWWLVLWLLSLPPPPFPPAALAELLQVLLGQKPDASGHS